MPTRFFFIHASDIFVVGDLFWKETSECFQYRLLHLNSTVLLQYALYTQSMPSIEEATELDEDYREAECALASSSLLGEQEVSIPALLAVISHKVTKIKDVIHLPPDCLSQEEHTEV